MKMLTIACVAVAACAGSQATTQRRTHAPENASVAAIYTCGDTVLQDQTTSGGERLAVWQPCWDVEPQTADHTELTAVAQPPAIDPKLAEVQEVACANVGPKERARSPFSHRKQIMEVTPHRVGNRLAGVRVVFERVPGLTAEWMRKDIACHRAQWQAMGRYTVASSDPTLIDGAQVSVFDRDGHVEVIVNTDTPEQAEIAIARAKGALVPLAGSQAAIR